MIALQPTTNWKALLTIALDLSAARTRQELTDVIHYKLKSVIGFNDCCLAQTTGVGPAAQNFLYYSASGRQRKESFAELAPPCEIPQVYRLDELVRRKNAPAYFNWLVASGIKSIAGISLHRRGVRTGHLYLLSEEVQAYTNEVLYAVRNLVDAFSAAMTNILVQEQWDKERAMLLTAQADRSVIGDVDGPCCADEMVGSGPGMQRVFQLVDQVAKAQSSVLIMGETGTGKELIARAVHNGSARKDKPMIKVNCATLPVNLIESELFGHERGSFTGALDRRIGKFELANNSTLFLDEVGELPLELQAKLLRALQEKEIERVGGKQVIQTNVRVIAATNRNLQKEVMNGTFRSDLYYRLNVFPIQLPPLRERKEDIPKLAAHFLNKFVPRGVKPVSGFSSRVMKEMMAYSWPGNIRELEHFIERSVLMTTGPVISRMDLGVGGKEEQLALAPDARVKSIEEVEREHIIAVLKMTNGKVAGIGGAAELLRIPSTTLASKIRRLKIKKGYTD